MVNKGMGRVRVPRFLAVAAPATVVSLGLGVAIAQGMVTAALSAADPFELGSSNVKADQLGLSLAGTQAAQSVGNDTATTKKAALARLAGGNLQDMCISAKQSFPILGDISLKISSTSPVAVGNIDLSADALNAQNAQLPATDIGTSAGDSAIGGTAGAFGLRTDKTDQGISLDNLDAKAYGIRLNSGINLKTLSIVPKLGVQHCS
ncbi:DUF6230 family protein [Flexivirga meconopsidis]|uniref:DUF6230 family protein n=1 Tax=Flexivirga meconopsidis TaxID=2977121 RepID=UPI00223F42FD|nr:DUF6230 family protein [Flexivirga meconopsidis]